MTTIEVLFTPADFALLPQRDLGETICVVFDVLRATSTMVTALANGAVAIVPVDEIAEALAIRQRQPEVLLAGERDGLRIPASLTGSIAFDLGNSPREFTQERVQGKTIVITTTNGTRALRACAGAKAVLAGCFLNLRATANYVLRAKPAHLLVVCSGTFEQTAYEDVLGAGALCDILWQGRGRDTAADSALMAHELYQVAQADLSAALARSRNARRLLERPDLRADVAFCVASDTNDFAVQLDHDGHLRKRG